MRARRGPLDPQVMFRSAMNHCEESSENMTQEKLLLRKSFREINRLRAELKKAETLSTAAIAIVGMSCRTPGGVQDLAGFWTVLAQGRDVVGPFPPRWDT